MAESSAVHELFDTLARVLLRAFALGYLLLLLWVAFYLVVGDPLTGQMFGLTAHELAVIHYCGIVAVKCVLWLFFLFPYVAIRLVLRKRG